MSGDTWQAMCHNACKGKCMWTHGLPCVTMHAKANACRTHGKPCVHLHGHGMSIKWDGDQFVEGERKKRGKGKEGKENKKEKRERSM